MPGATFHFTQTCVETCDNLDAPSNVVTVEFEVSDGAEMLLDQVTYTTSENNPPAWVGTTNTFEMTDTLTLDLSTLFFDPDGDTLTFLATAPELLQVRLEGSTLTLTPEPGFTSDTVSVIASDGIAISQATLIITRTTVETAPSITPVYETSETVQEPALSTAAPTQNVTTTGLLTTDGFSIATDVTACGTLTNANNTLINNVTAATGTCFVMNCNDCFLDCAGNTVTYGNTTSVGAGITAASRANITIRNCRFAHGGGGSAGIVGINLTSITAGSIQDSRVTVNGTTDSDGIALLGNTSQFTISNVTTAVTMTGSGTLNSNAVRLAGASGSVFVDRVNISSSTLGITGVRGPVSILMTNISNVIMDGNVISANSTNTGGKGIAASGVLVFNVTARNNTLALSSTAAGTDTIFLSGVAHKIINNTINSSAATTGITGIRFGSNASNASQNRVFVSGSNPIGLKADSSVNAIFEDNMVTIPSSSATTGYGLYAVTSALNTTFRRNNVTFTGSTANTQLIRVESQANLTWFDSNILTGDSTGTSSGVYIQNSYGMRFTGNVFRNVFRWMGQENVSGFPSVTANYTGNQFTTDFGSINITPRVQLNGTFNVTQAHLNVTLNRSYVNATNLTFFNTSAFITLNLSALSIVNPKPMLDSADTGAFVTCPASKCTEQSFTNSMFVFNVSSWTTFAAAETGNSAPTISSVILNTTNTSTNNTNQNLTLYLNGVADVDNDSVQNITDWRLWNGSTFKSLATLNMPFETNLSATTTRAVSDYSTSKNNGTLGGGTASAVPSWITTGRVGGAYKFDGINDYIDVPDNESLDMSSITISAWINTTTSGVNNMIVTRDTNSGAGTRIFQFRINAANKVDCILFIGGSADTNNIGLTSVNDGSWHHVACTYNQATGSVRVYFDGLPEYNETQAATALDSGTIGYYIGKFEDGGGPVMYTGMIDEVQVFNRPLSQQQIYQMYLEGNQGRHVRTMHANETELNDIWRVAVTPNDDVEDGATTSSNNVTILQTLNEAPSISQVILNTTNPSANSSQQDLTGFIIGVSDAEGDPVQNITDWRVNGSSLAALNLPFETNTSNLTNRSIRDYSTFKNNASLGGGASANAPAWNRTGIRGGSYRFDGTNDFIIVHQNESLDFTQQYTLEAWVNITAHKNYNVLFTRGVGEADDIEWYYTSTPQFTIVHNRGNGGTTAVIQQTVASPTAGQWTYVAVTYRNGTLRYFLNGAEVALTSATNVQAPLDTNRDWKIGATAHSAFGGTGFFQGQMDEVRFYNRSLSPEQIRQNYAESNASRGLKPVLLHNELGIGQNWTLAVTPNDNQPNTDGTTVLSNSVLLTSGIPSITSVTLNTTNPATNSTSTNLTVYVTGASDPDGDPVQNITDWRTHNGTAFNSIAILYMPFETNTSNLANTVVKDYSTYQNNGTTGQSALTQIPAWTSSGKVGGAYRFDGSNDRINITDSASITTALARSTTFEAWVNVNASTGAGQVIVGQGDSQAAAENTFLRLQLSSTLVPQLTHRTSGDASTQTVSATGAIAPNQWYHIAGVRVAGSELRIYVNGALNATAAGDNGNTFSSSRSLGIGVDMEIDGTDASAFFNGTIDEVRIYNRTLTTDQIRADFERGQTGIPMTMIVHNETTAGDIWQVAVTPNDNRQNTDGTTLFSNITILSNVAPSISQVILNSTNPVTNNTNQNLTAYVIGASDADGDAVRNITNWRRNGTSIAVWHLAFESNISSTSAGLIRDYGTHSNNATLGAGSSTNAPTWNLSGRVGGAYIYDGVNDYIQSATNGLNAFGGFGATTGSTMEAWIKTGSSASMSAVGFGLSSSATPILAMTFVSGTVRYQYRTDNAAELGGGIYDSTKTVNDNQWHHVVLRRSGTTFEIYIDGVVNKTGTDASSFNTLTTNRQVTGARRSTTDTQFFNGTIDEVRLYNFSLTPQQILQNFLDGNQSRDHATMVSTELAVGDIWQTAVTPNDGIEDGVAVLSNNVTIINNRPTIAQVILNSTNPASNSTQHNLTVTVINASDVEGDGVQNITDWRRHNGVNFTSIAVLNFPFETNVSVTTAKAIRDYSTFANNGTLGGGVSTGIPTFTNGTVGMAYSFDGTDDRINVSNNVVFNMTRWTLEAWIKPTAIGDTPIIVRTANAAGTQQLIDIPSGVIKGYTLRINTPENNGFCVVGDGSTAFSASSAANTVLTGIWTHLACAYNGSYITLYINGTAVATTSVGTISYTHTGDLQLGHGFTSTPAEVLYSGLIDEAFVYNRTLGAAELVSHYQLGKAGRRYSTMLSSELQAGDVWQVAVTPNDNKPNTDGETVLSNNVTIQANSAPIIQQVILNSTNPATNSTNHNLTVSVIGASDIDGEQVQNVTDWRRYNGTGFTSMAMLNMPFDINGSSNVRDYSTYQNNGTLGAGAASPTWNTSGKIGGAYQFDGGDYISRNTVTLPTGSVASAEAWIYPTAYADATYNGIVSWGSRTSADSFLLSIQSTGRPSFATWANDFVPTWGPVATLNAWNHIAAVLNGTYVVLYMNGQPIKGTIDATPNMVSTNLGIGITDYPGRYFTGLIDQMRVYNRSLSEDEVLQSMRDGNTSKNLMALVAQELQPNDIWLVAATPNDRTIDGTTVLSGNVTVVNSTPAITGLVLNMTDPATNDTNQNLTMYVTSAFDIDNDSFQNITDWRRNGTSIAVLNVPFETNSSTTVRDYSTFGNNGTTYGTMRAQYSVTASGNSYLYEDLTSVTDYVIASGDVLEYDVYWNSAEDYVAFDYTTSDASALRAAGATDQNGLDAHPTTDISGYARGKWYHRIISLPSGHVGKTIVNYDIATESDTTGTKLGYLDNIYITNGTGTIRKVIFDGSSFTHSTHLSSSATLTALDHLGVFARYWNATGKRGGGYAFDGRNDHITTTTSFVNPQDFTLSFWFKTAHASGKKIVGFEQDQTGEGTTNYDRHVWMGTDGKIHFGWNPTPIMVVNSTATLNDGNWHHVAALHNSSGSFGALYVDGVFQQSATGAAQSFTGYWRIGSYILTSWPLSSNGYFNGSIDEVLVFNRSLSSNEISRIILDQNQSRPLTVMVSPELRAGDVWTVAATPNDGTIDGPTTLSNNVTIQQATGCSTITGSTTLDSNVSSTGTCVTVGANDITLDCAGFTITYDTSGSGGASAVSASGRRNVTVKNCVFNDGTVGGGFGAGINFTSVNDSLIFNNTIQTNGTSDNYGVVLRSGSNNTVIRNNTVRTQGSSTDNYGINLVTATLNTVEGNTVVTNGTGTDEGIRLTSTSANNVVRLNNVNATSSSTNGLLVSSSSGNNVTNNTVRTGSGQAYRVESSSNNYVANNTGTSTSGNVFASASSSYNQYTRNIATSTSGNTFSAGGSNNESFTYNRGTSTSGNGLLLSASSSDNNITGNNFTSTSSTSVYIFSSSRNLLINNTVTSSSVYGMFVESSSMHNRVLTNTVSSSSSSGLRIDTSAHNNTFINSTFTSDTDRAVDIISSQNNTLINATLLTNSTWITADATSTGNTIANTVFWRPNGEIRFTPTITLSNSSTINLAKLNTSFNRAFLNATNLSFMNASAFIALNGLTFTDAQAVVDYADTGTNVTCPADVCTEVSYTGGVFVFNVSHWTTFQAQEFVTDCGNLTASSTLTNSVSSTGTCFIIAANDVTLDCAGFGITYDTSGAGGASGVLSFNHSNLVVKNCNINDFNASGALSTGINFTLVNNSQIFNNTIQTNGTTDNYGILLRGPSQSDEVWANTIRTRGTSSANYGVYLTGTNRYHNIFNNIILTNGTSSNQGVRLESGAANNTINNNTVTTGGTSTFNHGITLQPGANQNNITNNNVRTFVAGSTYGIESQANDAQIIGNNVSTLGTSTSNHGMAIISAARNVIRNNFVRSQGSSFNYGTIIQTTTDSVIELNDIRANAAGSGGHGLYLFSSSARNNVSNNTISSLDSGSNGVRIETTSTDNIIRNNTISTNGASTIGVYVLVTSNIIDGNVISTNGSSSGQYGVYVGASHIRVTNNAITTNGTTGNHGIYAFSSVTNLTATNNVITVGGTSTTSSPTAGIRLDTSVTNSVLTNNTITVTNSGAGSQGVLITASSNLNNFSMTTINIPSNVNATGVRVEATSLNNTFNYTTISIAGNEPALSVSTSNTTRFFNTHITARTKWIDAVTTQINITNTTFNSSAGRINYQGSLFSAGTVNVTAAKLNTSFNRAFLNATNLTFLNASAFITLQGLPFADPVLRVDYSGTGTNVTCPSSTCTRISYSGGTLLFNVSHWTTFTSGDNTVPTIAQVILNTTNPATNDTNQNLTAYVINATDADGNDVQNITDWRKHNGVNFTSLAVANTPFETDVSSLAIGAVRDYSTFANNGTLGNGTAGNGSTWTSAGRVGGAYVFDGVDDFIDLGASPVLNFGSGNFTYEAWIKTSALGVGSRIIAQDRNLANNRALAIFGTTNKSLFTCRDSSSNQMSAVGNTTIPDGNWHHVVGVRNGSTALIYVDGVLENMTTNTAVGSCDGDTSTRIGKRGAAGFLPFNGTIDEVRIYNFSLTAGQVLQNYLDGNASRHSMTVHSDETNASDVWQTCATPNDNIIDGSTVCSNNVTIQAAAGNTAPTAPVLLFPANNSNVTTRSPNFNWSNSTDAEGVSVNYSIEIATNPSFSSIVVNTTGINSLANSNTTNFTISQVLDVDTVYWWRVIATDGTFFSPYSGVFNFTLQSFLSITLINDTVNFGNVTLGVEKNTTNESVFPFLLENTGNVFVNITITGEKIFQQAAFPSTSYRYKARANESGAFNTGASTLTFTNVTNVSTTKDIVDLNWTNAKDDAKIDVQIVTPTDEPPGVKNSTFTFTVA